MSNTNALLVSGPTSKFEKAQMPLRPIGTDGVHIKILYSGGPGPGVRMPVSSCKPSQNSIGQASAEAVIRRQYPGNMAKEPS